MFDLLLERQCILLEMGMPQAWAESYARLYHAPRPASLGEASWRRIILDAGLLWDRWGARLIALDWAPIDVRNLFPVIRGRTIVAVGFGDVSFDDGEKAFKRPVLGKAPVWQEGRRSA